MPEVVRVTPETELSCTEYKTVKQYQALGDMLNEFKVYGYQGALKQIAERGIDSNGENGHNWLTEDSYSE